MLKRFIIVFSFLSFHSVNLYASLTTVDSNTNIFIPVQHIQSGEFFIQRAPMIGCYGLPRGPQLQQLTKAYMVNNLGCGTETQENINALSCSILLSSIEADDYSTFKEITLDIKACPQKDNLDFIYIVKKVIKLNFATKSYPNPKLILIK